MLQPAPAPDRYRDERSGKHMSIIGYIIKKAVESIPIDRERKDSLLQKLLRGGRETEAKDGGAG